ncbi:Cytidylate kinase [Prevotella communis]|uniref:Cytidylate kinase n=1 Tax=Prevotella communis TaxID=2913614 RepID=A0A1G7UZZ4_9BACT|nr:cytidylate kinase-like family protein [Prevotella communis]UKK60280.1 cytidylate kinase-like family protein [Prevotella communis]SDG53067.1 Cytidylate kinase [Prevotella communis]
MNKNVKFVITINRELGSGGRTVGRKLAERLGVEFYDKAVIKGLMEQYHLTVEEIEKLKGQKQGWWADIKRIMFVSPSMHSNYYIPEKGSEPELLDTDQIFEAETEILKGISHEESCVIAGRSGFHIFRNHPNHVSILIQASQPFRLERVMRKQGLSEKEALKVIKEVDLMRENYVRKHTGTSRYDTRNYDIVIKADGKTEDEIVDIIMMYLK